MSSQSYVQDRTYTVNMPTTDIPPSLYDEKIVKPLAMTSSLVSVPNQAGSQINGGQLIFPIPANSTSFLKQNSAYLRFDLAITTSNTGGTGCFANSANSAGAMIQRLTYACAGNTIENIQDYGIMLEPMILTQKTNLNWFESDGYATEYAGGTLAFSTSALTTNFNFAFPLIMGSFANHSWPLFLQSAPSMLTLELQGVLAKCITGTLVTGYTISNAYFCYENLQMDGGYIQSIRQSLAEGNLYTIPIVTYMGLTFGGATSISYNIGLNLSSILSFLYTIIAGPVNTAPCWHLGRNQTLAELYLDGRNVSTLGLNMDLTKRAPQVFLESRRAFNDGFGDVLSSVVVSPVYSLNAFTITNWENASCDLGFNLNHVSDSGYSFSGSNCSNLSFRWVGDNTASDQLYISIPHSACILFDASGNITKTI